jgi:hypothetical protein
MRIVFTDVFKTNWLKKFKIAEPDVLDTLLHSDTHSVHDLEKIKLDFYLKKLKQGYYLLVCTYWNPAIDELVPDVAVKLLASFVDAAQTKDPFKLLQYFVTRFGYELVVGSQKRGKFIFNETIARDPNLSLTDFVKDLVTPINPEWHGGNCCYKMNPRETDSGAVTDLHLVFCIDTDKYDAWIRNPISREGAGIRSSDENAALIDRSALNRKRISEGLQLGIEDFLRYKQIINNLFSPGWLEHHQKHPAYCQSILCDRIIERISQNKPISEARGLDVGRVVLNAHAQSKVLDDVGHKTGLGSLSLYGDVEAQKALRQDVLDPKSFEDVMVELYVSAWHISEGHAIERIKWSRLLAPEKIAVKIPDFIVTLPDSARLVIECKHMRPGTKADRIKQDIKKANKQIKSLADYEDYARRYYGAVVIDVTSFIGVQQVSNDDLPLNLRPLLEGAQAAIRGKKNRSLGTAVLVWDDYMKFPMLPIRLGYGYRRRVLPIKHESAHVPIPDSVPIYAGNTLEY